MVCFQKTRFIVVAFVVGFVCGMLFKNCPTSVVTTVLKSNIEETTTLLKSSTTTTTTFFLKETTTHAITRKEGPFSSIRSVIPDSTVTHAPIKVDFMFCSGTMTASSGFRIVNATIPISNLDDLYWTELPALFGPKKGSLNLHNPKTDTYISGSLFRMRMWESHILRSMQHFIQNCSPNVVVLDVGANVGYFSFSAALAGCRVISVEAVADNVRQIERTMKRNNLQSQWIVYHNALAHVTGETVHMKVTDARVNSGNYKLNTKGDGAPVYTVRLDDIVQEDIAYMKLDIEGHEAYAMSGAPELICTHNVNVIILEIIHDLKNSGCDWKQMIRWFEKVGYQLVSSRTYKTIPIERIDKDGDAILVLDKKRKLSREHCLKI